MSYRYMRIIVFYDLPNERAVDRRNYRKFRKTLINEGFIMMQESVYSKLVLNNSVCESVKLKIDKNKPKEGIVQILIVTEKQFASIETIVGGKQNLELETTERLIIL